MDLGRCILRHRYSNVTKTAVEWNSEGSRGRGPAKITWKRSVMKEAAVIGKTLVLVKVCS